MIFDILACSFDTAKLSFNTSRSGHDLGLNIPVVLMFLMMHVECASTQYLNVYFTCNV